VLAARVTRFANAEVSQGFLLPVARLEGAALPSVMRKCVALGLQGLSESEASLSG
jgi:hypothetical protein